MFSLRCSPHAVEGLQAQQTCLDLNPLRIAQTCASEHVIERTPGMVRAHRASRFLSAASWLVRPLSTNVTTAPSCFGSTQGSHRLFNRTLGRLLLGVLQCPLDAHQPVDALPHQVCDLVGALLGLVDGGANGAANGAANGGALMSGLSAGHLLAAKA